MPRRAKTYLSRAIRSAKQFLGLRPSEREARERALETVSLMRTQKLSLSRAARAAGTTRATALRYAGDALERDAAGRFRARRADRLFRRMQILGSNGRTEVDVRGSHAASMNARHWNAVKRFLVTGDVAVLRPFVGKRVGGHVLMTDPDAIEEEARRGEVAFEDIYRTTEEGS